MKEADVAPRLAMGEDPLDLAIEKWMDIRDGRGEDYGSENCALCIAFSCYKCPVYYKVGRVGCAGTPYESWRNHRKAIHYSIPGTCECPECEKIADAEITFLKSFKELETP